MWLDDDEIRERLESGEAQPIEEALEAIDSRWSAGEAFDLPPLNAKVLAAHASSADYSQTNRLLRFLLGVPGMPALNSDAAFDEVAKLVAWYFPFDTMHAVAMTLQVHAAPTKAVARVLCTLGDFSSEVGKERADPIEHFISCLLDADDPIRLAASTAIKRWPPNLVANTVRSQNGLT